MKRCCFITQEDLNGVLTVIRDTITHWPCKDSHQIMILCNQSHWAYSEFQKLKKTNQVEFVVKCPFRITQDFHKIIDGFTSKIVIKKLLYGIIRLSRPILSVWRVYKLKRLFLKYNVSATFSHNGGYPGGELNRLATIAAKFAGIKKNYMIIHNFPVTRHRLMGFLSKIQDWLIMYSAKKIFSVSQSCATALQRQRFNNTSVEVIYNGLSTDNLINNVKYIEPPSWKAKSAVIMFVGELHSRKGLDFLFDALGDIKNEFTLVLYGTGSKKYIDYLKQKAKRLGYFRQVHFKGFHPDASKMIKFCNFLVLPSIAYESFGMVLLEAMYWKKPVICSDFGGMKEVVQHEHTGLITSAGSVEDLRDAIQYLIDNPYEAKKWGSNGFKRLEKNFDIKLTAERYCKLA